MYNEYFWCLYFIRLCSAEIYCVHCISSASSVMSVYYLSHTLLSAACYVISWHHQYVDDDDVIQHTLSSTETWWAHPPSDCSLLSPNQLRQDSRTQIRLAMAARPTSAQVNSAESKRTDLRANEKKCCEFFLCSLTVKCDSLYHVFCIINTLLNHVHF